MAYTIMVPDNVSITSQNPNYLAYSTTFAFTSLLKQTPPTARSFEADGMFLIREAFRQHGVSGPTYQIIIASWRSGTKKCYRSALRKWIQFCARTKTHPIRPTLGTVLDFLTKQFLSGSQYNSLNITRSALSAVVPPLEGVTVGSHPLVKRLMKGTFNLRPPKARYSLLYGM